VDPFEEEMKKAMEESMKSAPPKKPKGPDPEVV
jgi:hypothetical protein